MMSIFGKKKQAEEQSKEERTWQQNLVMDLKDLFYVLAIFMLLYMLLFRVVVVVGSSMYDTLHNNDRLLLISNTIYTKPKQGDIIVASKKSFANGECIVKRVIATEGQRVEINYLTGEVKVDGVVLEEDYIYTPTTSVDTPYLDQIVGKGQVFVMGDNRCHSLDSRSTEIGLIDEREILGKAVFLLSPADDGTGTAKNRFGVID